MKRAPFLLSLGLWLLAPVGVWLALRSLDWAHVGEALRHVRPGQLALLVALNLLILSLFSLRWWIILRHQGFSIPFGALAGYRLAAFSLSYFTPGTQFGGEPLQVYALQKRHATGGAAALASVTLDKLFELQANFLFLAFGILLVVSGGLFGEHLHGGAAWSAAVTVGALLLGIALYLIVLSRSRFPLSHLGALLPDRVLRITSIRRLISLLVSSERQVSTLLQHAPGLILAIALLSLFTWSLMVLEYWLTLRFLGAPLNPVQAIAALTAARLAFLTPLPGAAGALEASQVFALQAMGVEPAVALGVVLLIRARDLSLGALGLWLASHFAQSHLVQSFPLRPLKVQVNGGINDEPRPSTD